MENFQDRACDDPVSGSGLEKNHAFGYDLSWEVGSRSRFGQYQTGSETLPPISTRNSNWLRPLNVTYIGSVQIWNLFRLFSNKKNN